MKILYHFTCREHLPKIFCDGFLKLTESNIGSTTPRWKPYGVHVGPDVVWLSEVENLTCGHGLNAPGSAYNKLAIRFTVRAKAIHWPAFAAAHGINKKWYRLLNATGGRSAQKWWVCPTVIQSPDWLEIRDMKCGKINWDIEGRRTA